MTAPAAPRYSMVIEWSDEDQAYIVSFPEWGANTHTHGATYEEAVQRGQEVLADLVALWQAEGRALPTPRVFVATALISRRSRRGGWQGGWPGRRQHRR